MDEETVEIGPIRIVNYGSNLQIQGLHDRGDSYELDADEVAELHQFLGDWLEEREGTA